MFKDYKSLISVLTIFKICRKNINLANEYKNEILI